MKKAFKNFESLFYVKLARNWSNEFEDTLKKVKVLFGNKINAAK